MNSTEFFELLEKKRICLYVDSSGRIRQYGRGDVCPIAALANAEFTPMTAFISATAPWGAIKLGLSMGVRNDIMDAADRPWPRRKRSREFRIKMLESIRKRKRADAARNEIDIDIALLRLSRAEVFHASQS